MTFLTLILLSINSLHYCIRTYGLQESLLIFLALFSEILFLIFSINFVMKLPSKDPVDFRIIKYCFEYNLERYYALFVVFSSICSFLFLILFFHIQNFTKSIDLIALKNTLIKAYFDYSLIIFFCNMLLFLLCIVLIVLIFKSLRIFINKEIVKLHIYYLDKTFYVKCHNAFSNNYTLNNLIISKIDFLVIKLCDFMALGYYKNSDNYTAEEKKKTFNFLLQKPILEKFFYFTHILFYNLHYIFLLFFIIYDMYTHDYIIILTFKYLPFMFLYQVYINLSKFVREKPCYDVCANANIFFYHKVIFISKDTMILDGEFYEIPKTFAEDFLKYEASGFTKY